MSSSFLAGAAGVVGAAILAFFLMRDSDSGNAQETVADEPEPVEDVKEAMMLG